jgi:hypothetical protein
MFQMVLSAIRTRALGALIPPPRLRLSEWIEANIKLPEGVSALPGHVRLWPYQREIADAISDPEIERITLVKPVRVGFTTLLTGAIGSFVVNEPAPILVLLPTESDYRDYVVSDIEPSRACTRHDWNNTINRDSRRSSVTSNDQPRHSGSSSASPERVIIHFAAFMALECAAARSGTSQPVSSWKCPTGVAR